MIKRVLAFTSSVLFAAVTTPWPAHGLQNIVLLRKGADKPNQSGGVNPLPELPADKTRKIFPMSMDYFRETKRLQEIHYAVAQQSMVPLWQDPMAQAFRQRVQQQKARAKLLVRPPEKRTSIPNSPTPRPDRLSSRSGTSVIQQTLSEDTGVRIASIALSLVGCPYRWGGESLSGFDCSGFTQYAFRKAGIYIPRTSYDQAHVGRRVAMSALRPGDLVFFSTSGAGASHVAIYVGNGLIVQALNGSSGVIVSHLNASYYQLHFYTARRIVV